MIVRFVAFAVAGLSISSVVEARNAFTGPHVEAIVGYDQTDVAPGRGAANGVIYGIGGGYDVALGAVRLGGEAEINESSGDEIVAGSAQRVGRSLYLGGRFGIPIIDSALLYAKGGYANGRFLGPADYTGSGFRIGGGAEVAITNTVFGRAEYRYSDYGQTARGQNWVLAIGARF